MSTLYIATTGGHLTQLRELSTRLPADGDAVWVTHDNPQSRSLLAGEDARFVRYVRPRSLRDVNRCLPEAHRLLRAVRPTRAVSTGSGIALGFLPYLAARGVECHYIESATRVGGPSLTGRVLHHTPGVRLYTQYRQLAGGRWRYGGNVFDCYRPAGSSVAATTRIRVVVTLGIATGFGFRRLLEHLVPLLAPRGDLARATGRAVDVCWQVAGTDVTDLPIDGVSSLPASELSGLITRADVVISHGGTGSASAILECGRFPLLVPRRAVFGEAGDEHQAELAAELDQRGLCRAVEADEITVDDITACLARTIRRATPVPAFELRT